MFSKMEPFFDFRCKDNTFYRNNQKLWLFLYVFSEVQIDKSGCKDREVDTGSQKAIHATAHIKEQIDKKRKKTDDNAIKENGEWKLVVMV